MSKIKHITIIAGARPNFMKIAPIIHAIQKVQADSVDLNYSLVHTGQHYDEKMSGQFFQELEIPNPTINLNAGGGTQAEQTAAIMVGFEAYLLKNPTDLVLVVGDVTSTMACSIVAQKLRIRVAHVEAGIRSGDWSMPEEINRLVTDAITDYFFTTSEVANANLKKNGVSEDRIFFVGNTMIDTLLRQMPNLKRPALMDELGLKNQNYAVMTLHRPANVDGAEKLGRLLNEIIAHSGDLNLIFPVHPRTLQYLDQLNIKHPRLYTVEPLGYLEFNYLVKHAKIVITDSGGITEETTVMGVPCMTLRDNTERPETISIGTNELIGTNPENIGPNFDKLFAGKWKKGEIPPLWDGNTAPRIIRHLLNVDL